MKLSQLELINNRVKALEEFRKNIKILKAEKDPDVDIAVNPDWNSQEALVSMTVPTASLIGHLVSLCEREQAHLKSMGVDMDLGEFLNG